MEPVPLTYAEVYEALAAAKAKVEEPRELVGNVVPRPARLWANENRIPWRETAFAPPGRLFIVGAVPVEGVLFP